MIYLCVYSKFGSFRQHFLIPDLDEEILTCGLTEKVDAVRANSDLKTSNVRVLFNFFDQQKLCIQRIESVAYLKGFTGQTLKCTMFEFRFKFDLRKENFNLIRITWPCLSRVRCPRRKLWPECV